MAPFKVTTAEYLSLSPQNHVRIHITTNAATGRGQIYHVTGSIRAGMAYETRKAGPPDAELEYIPDSRVAVGMLRAGADLQAFDALCRRVEPPACQVDARGRMLPGVTRLRRCGEWVVEVLELARREGLVVPHGGEAKMVEGHDH